MSRSIRVKGRGLLASMPGTLRYSSARKALIASGASPANVAEFDADKLAAGSLCDVHGELTDPIVALTPAGDRVAFGCPWCSSPEVLAAWEAEGKGS